MFEGYAVSMQLMVSVKYRRGRTQENVRLKLGAGQTYTATGV